MPCYHTIEWNSGQVYLEDAYPNLLFAMDGEVYNLGGIETLVIGGAYSIDKFYRLAYGYGWWPDEQSSSAIKEKVERVLDERAWKVDAVLSHTTPLKYEPVEMFLSGVDQSKVDKSTEEWLDTIEDRLDYKTLVLRPLSHGQEGGQALHHVRGHQRIHTVGGETRGRIEH